MLEKTKKRAEPSALLDLCIRATGIDESNIYAIAFTRDAMRDILRAAVFL